MTVKHTLVSLDMRVFALCSLMELHRCVKHGYCSSDVYTAKDSIALTRLMYDIRMSWNMIFDGETQV